MRPGTLACSMTDKVVDRSIVEKRYFAIG